MRKNVRLILCLQLVATFLNIANAQTPSVGIGINNPNPKSVLHLFAPQGNQGLLLPKLTTAQLEENSFKNSLTEAEKGLMVYDTDKSQMFTWDGGQWRSSSKLSFPIIDTIRTSPGSPGNLMRLVYEGTTNEGVGIIHAENRNPNNGFSAYFGLTNSLTNGVADFVISNSQNTNDGIGVVTNGIGRAGAFRVNNANNEAAGVFSITNGKAGSAAIQGQNTGLGRAGFFSINNVDNTAAAISANTNGKGNAGYFQVDNTSSTVAALNATTNGIAGSVAVRGMATNNGTGVAAFSNGNGFISPAIYAEQSGTGDAAGVFKLTNAGNNYNAVFGETLGGGATFFAIQKGTGRAGQFQINNVTNNEAAVRGFTDGLGRAGFFTISNLANTADAVHSVTNGGGFSIFGQNTGVGSAAKFEISNPANDKPAVEIVSKSATANGLNVILEGGNTGDAIFAQKTTGFGSAGNFQNQNAANEASVLFASTNASGGSAMGAANFGNGNALSIWGGGLRLSTATLNGGGNISVRNAAYEIIGGIAYTFQFPLSNGETFFIYNNTASPATVNGISIAANTGKTFIVLNGVLRSM
jgi:hypothetical protein